MLQKKRLGFIKWLSVRCVSMDKVKKSLFLALFVSLVSMVVVIWLTMDIKDLEHISKINPLYLIIALTFHVGSWVIWSARIKTLTKAIGGHISFSKTFKIVVSSLFAAAITPSQAGGEPVRIFLLTEDLNAGDATAVILADRFLDMAFLILISPLSLFLFADVIFSGGLIVFLSFTVALFTFAIFLTVMVIYRPEVIKRGVKKARPLISKFKNEGVADQFINRVDGGIDSFVLSMQNLAKRRLELIFASICTVVYWSMEFFIASLILIGLSYPPEILHTYAAQILLTVIVLVPITPGSSGISELSFAALFSTFVKGAPMGVFVVLWRLITYHFNLIAGGVAITRILGDFKLIGQELK